PSGSEANKIIRDRIVGKMQARGFDVSLQKDFACQQKWAACSNIENIIAVKKGTVGNSTIMLMSHYDSVPASAAATDDGFGVAASLEIARALQSSTPMKNNLIILFTDAEEIGLLGAEAFASNHPLAASVDLLINIESRGTSGQSTMFETGTRNNKLLDIFKTSVKRPVANSLTYEVYKRMPNDTDYTVFKERDIPGLNFASTGSAIRYHSVLDDLTHMDKSTLQQHGENALNLLHTLGNMDLTDIAGREGSATYFDFYSILLVKWPSFLNIPLSAIGLLVLIGLFIGGFRGKAITPLQAVWSVGGIITALIASIGLPALLAFPLGFWQDLHPIYHPNPWPGKTAILLACLIGVLVTARIFLRKVSLHSLTLSIWTIVAAISLATSLTISGASYIALAPLFAFFLGLSIDYYKAQKRYQPLEYFYSLYAGFFVAAYISFYHFHLLDLVLNFDMSAAKAATLSIATLTLLPIAHSVYQVRQKNFRQHTLTLSATTAIITAFAMQIQTFSEDEPDPLNILYVEDARSEEAYFTLEHYLTPRGETSKYFPIMGFTEEAQAFPFTRRQNDMRPRMTVPSQRLPAPTLDIISDQEADGMRTIKFNIKTGRAGTALFMQINETNPLKSLNIKNVDVLGSSWKGGNPIQVLVGGAQDDIFPVLLTASAGENFSIILIEESSLPDTPEAKQLLTTRPAYANKIQRGDRSMVYVEVPLN
ncbi:MAG: M20/M25/M40 family metallo-hydrolase, partial [Kordiimonas sp.]